MRTREEARQKCALKEHVTPKYVRSSGGTAAVGVAYAEEKRATAEVRSGGTGTAEVRTQQEGEDIAGVRSGGGGVRARQTTRMREAFLTTKAVVAAHREGVRSQVKHIGSVPSGKTGIWSVAPGSSEVRAQQKCVQRERKR